MTGPFSTSSPGPPGFGDPERSASWTAKPREPGYKVDLFGSSRTEKALFRFCDDEDTVIFEIKKRRKVHLPKTFALLRLFLVHVGAQFHHLYLEVNTPWKHTFRLCTVNIVCMHCGWGIQWSIQVHSFHRLQVALCRQLDNVSRL